MEEKAKQSTCIDIKPTATATICLWSLLWPWEQVNISSRNHKHRGDAIGGCQEGSSVVASGAEFPLQEALSQYV